jgi:hypothetical protein
MPILTGTGNTLLCPRFGYGKRISTRAKSVNSEHRHRQADSPLIIWRCVIMLMRDTRLTQRLATGASRR